MSNNQVNVTLKLNSLGVKEAVYSSAKIRANLEGAQVASNKLSSSTKKSSAQAIASDEGLAYGRARAGVGTGAAGRDFAKQSQGLGGLVHLYATFAANIFAVGAAYEALNKAAQTERLIKASSMMSVQVGANLNGISKNLVEASGHALSFTEAMQFTNIGTSAGLAGKQIENLTKIARGAASALGRDANDSIRRIIQGTAKQEQEILDELGIFVKSKQAFEKYAKEIGVKADDLTGRQRTQAYANEVERLGEKWKSFAEIDDPFSRFAATGKNALTELLNSVNSVFKPILSYLADSKDAIQGIIILVSTILVKRALPELGGIFNNLFNYDKIAGEASKSKMIKDLDDQLAAVKLRSKSIAEELAKVSTGTGIIDVRGDIYNRTQAFKNVPGISAGINNQGLATDLVGSVKNPKSLETIKKHLEDNLYVQNAITKNLDLQLVSEKSREKVLAQLVSRGLVEKESTAGNLKLTEMTRNLAANITTDLTKRVAMQASSNALAKEGLLISEKELALEAEKASLGSLGLKKYSVEKAGISDALGTAGSKASIAFSQGLSGILPGLAEVGLGIKNIAGAMGAASSIGTKFAGVLGILRLGVTGLIGVMGALVMPVMLLITGWEIFGDKIKEWLPESIKAFFNIDKTSKVAEEASAKIKELAETSELLGQTQANLNELFRAGFNSTGEMAQAYELRAKTLQSYIGELDKVIAKQKEVENRKIVDEYRKEIEAKGGTYNEQIFKIDQDLKDPAITKEYYDKLLAIRTRYLAAIDAKNSGTVKDLEEFNKWYTDIATAERGIRVEESKLVEQRSTMATSQKAALDSIGKGVEAITTLSNKAKDPITSLGENGKKMFEGLSTALNGKALSGSVYTETIDNLRTVIEKGGKAAKDAIPLYVMLQQIINDPSSFTSVYDAKTGESSLSLNMKVINDKIAQAKELKGMLVALSSNADKPGKGKAAPEYDTKEKTYLKDLKRDIEATKLEQLALDKLFANTSSLDKRIAAVQGYQSAQAIANERNNADAKVELDYTTKLDEARKSLFETIFSSTRSAEDKQNAIDAFHVTFKTLGLMKETGIQAAIISEEESSILTEVAKITKEYDKQSKTLSIHEKARSNALEIEEAMYDLSQVARTYSEEEKFLRIPEKEQALRRQTFDITRAGHERDIRLTQLELKYTSDINALVAKRLPPEDTAAEALRLLNERTTSEEEANAAYKTSIELTAIHTKTALAEANKASADESRGYWEDALERAFDSGKGFFKSLWNSIKDTLKKQVLKVGVTAVMGAFGISDAIAGTGGTSSGYLNSITSLPNTISTLGTAVSGLGTSVSAFAEGVSLGWNGVTATAGIEAGIVSSAAPAATGAGSMMGALVSNPYTWIAAAVIAAIALEGGETRSGGQYVYSKDGQDAIDPNTGKTVKANNIAGMLYATGPSGGQIDGTKEIVDKAPASINSLLELVGSKAIVTAYQAGVETSTNDRGGVYAGGTLSTGGTFGESGKGNNYKGTLYDPMYGFELNQEEAAKYLAQDIQASSIEALQAATDIPQAIKDMLEDYSARPEEKTKEGIAAKAAENTSILNAIAGVAAFNKALKTLPFEELKEQGFTASVSLLKASAGAQQAGEALDTYLARGMQNLQTNLSGFYENFYTAGEKTANVTKAVTSSLAEQNIVLPKVDENLRSWYRSEVERLGAMDLSIESNSKAYVSILALQGTISELANIGEAAADELANIGEAAADELKTWQDRLDILMGIRSEKEISRERELEDAVDDTTRAIMQQVYAQEDLAEVISAITSAQDDAMSMYMQAQSTYNDIITQEQKDITEAAEKAAEAIRSALASAGKGISDLIRQLTTDPGTLDPMALMRSTRGAYLEDLRLSQTGDVEASNRIASSAKAFIDASKEVSNNRDQAMTVAQVVYSLGKLPAVKTYEQQLLDAVNSTTTAVGKSAEEIADALNAKLTAELAVSARSEILKLINFVANTDKLPAELKLIALSAGDTFSKTISFIQGSSLTPENMQLAIMTESSFVRTFNFIAQSTLDDEEKLQAFSAVTAFDRTINIITGSLLSTDVKKQAFDTASNFNRTINVIAGTSLTTDLKQQAFGLVTNAARTINILSTSSLSDALVTQAFGIVNNASRTINIIAGSQLTAAQKQQAFDGLDDADRTINVIAGSLLNDIAKQQAFSVVADATRVISVIADSKALGIYKQVAIEVTSEGTKNIRLAATAFSSADSLIVSKAQSSVTKNVELALQQADPVALSILAAQSRAINNIITASGGVLTEDQRQLIDGVDKYNKEITFSAVVDSAAMAAVKAAYDKLASDVAKTGVTAPAGTTITVGNTTTTTTAPITPTTTPAEIAAAAKENLYATIRSVYDDIDSQVNASTTDAKTQTWGAKELALIFRDDKYKTLEAVTGKAAVAGKSAVSMQDIANARGQSYNSVLAGFAAFGILPFAQGTNYLPYDQIAMVHEGERIIPKADNRELMQRLQNPQENSVVLAEGLNAMTIELAAVRAELAQIKSDARQGIAHQADSADSLRKLKNNGVQVWTDPAEPLKTEVAA